MNERNIVEVGSVKFEVRVSDKGQREVCWPLNSGDWMPVAKFVDQMAADKRWDVIADLALLGLSRAKVFLATAEIVVSASVIVAAMDGDAAGEEAMTAMERLELSKVRFGPARVNEISLRELSPEERVLVLKGLG